MAKQIKKLLILLGANLLGLNSRFWPRPGRKKAIVVFFSGKLGDMVCLTPVLKALKQFLGDGELIVYARKNFLPIWDNNPYLDLKIGFVNEAEALSWSWLVQQWRLLNNYSIEVYLNLVNNFEGGILGITLPAKDRRQVATSLDGRWLRLLYPYFTVHEYKFDRQIKEFYFEILNDLQIPVNDRKNELFFSGQNAAVDDFWQQNNLAGRLVVGLAISSGKNYFKIWPADYWAELAKLLKEKFAAAIVIFGLRGDQDIIDSIRKNSHTDCLAVLDESLSILPYFLKKCDLFISVDMGVLYIADALKVPVVDIIGPCDENTQRPENNFRLLTNREVCPAYSKMLDSPVAHFDEMKRCYESIVPEQVLCACSEIIKVNPKE